MSTNPSRLFSCPSVTPDGDELVVSRSEDLTDIVLELAVERGQVPQRGALDLGALDSTTPEEALRALRGLLAGRRG